MRALTKSSTPFVFIAICIFPLKLARVVATPIAAKQRSRDSLDTARIPRVINKFFFQHSGELVNLSSHEKWREAHTTWTKRNPGYRLRYWSVDDARLHLTSRHPPIYLRTFECLRAYSNKADFFRYVLLHDEGGWYSDWKQVCLKVGLLDSLMATGKLDFFFFDEGAGVKLKNRSRVQNAFFGVEKNNLFLKRAIQRTIKNTKKKLYAYPTVLHVSGPGLLGNVYAHEQHRTNISEDDYYFGNYFYHRNERVVQHKCDACTKNQDWAHGNNYNTLWNRKKFYCEK
ncbi:hypothetical protein CYMTET_55140 [Cymbomonas tetramitiformis]|uniref:Uncharacterized protein n=1 Tax=Cymbomonas tetramitiformis TaxID=36881 RepID=A0AAE0BFA7_9CHLO|nr:hypothetical protein CYMTET_55140 [Cymbomonas tetramitiformis]